MYKGIISSIERSKGYGFIEAEDGERIFFHQRWLRKVRFRDLHKGDEVVFLVNMGERGPRAHHINLAANIESRDTYISRKAEAIFK